MKVEVVKCMLMVHDMDRAIRFYRDTIGLELRIASPHWSELCSGGFIVALHEDAEGDRRDTGLSFQVSDIETALDEVRKAGATVLGGPFGKEIRLADVLDPEGNHFMFAEYTAAYKAAHEAEAPPTNWPK